MVEKSRLTTPYMYVEFGEAIKSAFLVNLFWVVVLEFSVLLCATYFLVSRSKDVRFSD